ncbi:hypothetical protein EDC19_0325 [Natranaerovirga hydrolytica]|uniref:YceG-like family protein n=1 Tax=Natranaerovirga hydrolytica TaxID=680378 RepID=A0A4R1N5N4_9FIRM|nr:hypothetical protein [Natranaerovirga hydrolytica]TCK97923.1 hypothetical protein EDC19_0325 [Natranaerovirga hydrolytica]
MGIILASIVFALIRPTQQSVVELSEEEIIAKARALGLRTQKEFLEQNSIRHSDEEIITRAKALGMAFVTEGNSHQIEGNQSNSNDKEEVLIEAPRETIEVAILYGMTSEDVSSLLLDKKIIEDEEAFRNYLIQNNLSRRIRVGRYEMLTDMDYEEIGKIITNKN